jgi:hypothetical protein
MALVHQRNVPSRCGDSDYGDERNPGRRLSRDTRKLEQVAGLGAIDAAQSKPGEPWRPSRRVSLNIKLKRDETNRIGSPPSVPTSPRARLDRITVALRFLKKVKSRMRLSAPRRGARGPRRLLMGRALARSRGGSP